MTYRVRLRFQNVFGFSHKEDSEVPTTLHAETHHIRNNLTKFRFLKTVAPSIWDQLL